MSLQEGHGAADSCMTGKTGKYDPTGEPGNGQIQAQRDDQEDNYLDQVEYIEPL